MEQRAIDGIKQSQKALEQISREMSLLEKDIDSKRRQEYRRRGVYIKKIPSFWGRALMGHSAISKLVTGDEIRNLVKNIISMEIQLSSEGLKLSVEIGGSGLQVGGMETKEFRHGLKGPTGINYCWEEVSIGGSTEKSSLLSWCDGEVFKCIVEDVWPNPLVYFFQSDESGEPTRTDAISIREDADEYGTAGWSPSFSVPDHMTQEPIAPPPPTPSGPVKASTKRRNCTPLAEASKLARTLRTNSTSSSVTTGSKRVTRSVSKQPEQGVADDMRNPQVQARGKRSQASSFERGKGESQQPSRGRGQPSTGLMEGTPNEHALTASSTKSRKKKRSKYNSTRHKPPTVPAKCSVTGEPAGEPARDGEIPTLSYFERTMLAELKGINQQLGSLNKDMKKMMSQMSALLTRLDND